MNRILLLMALPLMVGSANSQKFITKNGYLSFFSHTPIEDIKADNNQVASVLDVTTGDIVFQLLIRSFHFEKAVMEEHFNENYLESDKFPKSTFSGKITNLNGIDFSKNGKYDAQVEGDLTIHGVTRKVSANGQIVVDGDGINASAKFNITPEDFNIAIPTIVRNNIAKIFEVTVVSKYSPLDGK